MAHSEESEFESFFALLDHILWDFLDNDRLAQALARYINERAEN
jgi:hypothetical protein